MLRFLGRHASLLAFGVVAAVVLGPLTVFWPGAGALAVALLGALGALAAHARATALRVRCDVLSREIDALSKRLLRAEALAAARPGRAADWLAVTQTATVSATLVSARTRRLRRATHG